MCKNPVDKLVQSVRIALVRSTATVRPAPLSRCVRNSPWTVRYLPGAECGTNGSSKGFSSRCAVLSVYIITLRGGIRGGSDPNHISPETVCQGRTILWHCFGFFRPTYTYNSNHKKHPNVLTFEPPRDEPPDRPTAPNSFDNLCQF